MDRHSDTSIPRTFTERFNVTADQVLLLLVAFNLLMTTGDVIIAHSFNEFALDTQYLPLLLGLAGAAAGFAAIPGEPGRGRRLFFAVGMWLSVALGVLGFFWHLESQVIWRGMLSLKTYVYTAPLMAPMAYAGVALIGLIAIRRQPSFAGWTKRRWLYALTGLGSFGNASLCILDHARNGFIHPTEWIPVPVTLFSGAVFLWMAFEPKLDRVKTVTLWTAIALQILVGSLGWVLHVYNNLTAQTGDLIHRIIYGPPIFSPLLLADVATFGATVLLFTFRYEREPVEGNRDSSEH